LKDLTEVQKRVLEALNDHRWECRESYPEAVSAAFFAIEQEMRSSIVFKHHTLDNLQMALMDVLEVLVEARIKHDPNYEPTKFIDFRTPE
jgi:hypothetical protein